MGLSTGRALHIDALLSNVAINYAPQTFIADQIAPIVSVQKETGIYPIFSRQEFFTAERDERSRASEANKITRSVSSAGYAVKNYALGMDMPIEDIANMDSQYEYELGAGNTRYLVGKLALNMERRVTALANAAASVSTTFVPSSSWLAGGDPFVTLLAAKEQQKTVIGQMPNSILIGWKAHNWLMRNVNMRNLIKGTNNGGGIVSRQQLADILEVDRYIVSDVMQTTQNEATIPSSLSLSPVFPADKIVLYYRPAAPSREEPSWMYAFRWQNPDLPTPMAVERHPYDSRRKVVGIEAGYYQDEKVTGPEYAVAIAGVGSAQANGI